MKNESSLFSRCHVNENTDGDRFVGIKADSDNAMVYFPIGYELPNDDQLLRQDIIHLIAVLSEFTDKKDRVLAMEKFAAPQSVDFPINAYMEIINYFMNQNGYYTEKESTFKTSDSGKVNWAKTFRRNRPLIQSNGSPVYTDFTVRVTSPNNNMITQIHKFCVYESFSKLGWLFTPYLPEKPVIERNDKMFLNLLRTKLSNTYNDVDKRLFTSMIAMIEYLDSQPNEKQFYFGTDRFEFVWERLIDKVFGIENKNEFFPRTSWALKDGLNKRNSALEPDTIMLVNGNIYVLDAKYYRYGITGEPSDLPNSSSINKQITYGEYLYNHQKFKNLYGDDVPVYNAFILPYNSKDNLFEYKNRFVNFGEAESEWKNNLLKYEKVQGIIVDIRYLMYRHTGDTKKQMIELANSIEEAFTKEEYRESVQ